MSVVPQRVSCSNGGNLFPHFATLSVVKYKYSPFCFREVSLFLMAFATAALVDVIASVGTLSERGPRGSGKVDDDELSWSLLLDFLVIV